MYAVFLYKVTKEIVFHLGWSLCLICLFLKKQVIIWKSMRQLVFFCFSTEFLEGSETTGGKALLITRFKALRSELKIQIMT
jgi:hypothetical protein